MATFKSSTKYRVTNGTGSVRQEDFPEAASQTFKRGDLVYLVSGKVTVVPSSPTTEKILGMALADASGTTDTMLPVLIADDNVEFSVPVYHGTPASAITAVTDVGLDGGYGLKKATVSSRPAWALDLENTTNDVLFVQSIDKEFPAGTQYGRYWVKVAPLFRELNV